MRRTILLVVLITLAPLAAFVWYYNFGRHHAAQETKLPARLADGRLTPEAERAALLGDILTVGFNETVREVTVRHAGEGGAVFTMPGNREVRIDPPEGESLTGEFVVLNAISGGFFLGPAPGGDRPLYVTFVDARRPLEPADSASALATYEAAAARIGEAGKLPFLDGMLEVTEVAASPGAVFYCLRRADGMLFQGGTSFVGPLSVTVMHAGGCDPDGGTGRVGADLARAEATLAANR